MSGPGAISKPTVFLSHAATDQPIAQVISDEIKRIFADGVRVYASSVPGVVKPGQDWLGTISDALSAATAVVVIVTPTSINRPWIWFEVGASWSQMEDGQGRILPLCYCVEKGDLPDPLGRLQAMSLSKASETREVFQTLIDSFGFGSLKGYRHATIKAKLPTYSDLSVAESDIRSGTIYTGPYQDYTDEELFEVLEDEYVLDQWRDYDDSRPGYRPGWGENLFTSRLVHFREVDEQFGLPSGTAKRLLVSIIEQGFYPAKVAKLTRNTVRIQVDDAELAALESWREAQDAADEEGS